jgi:hypothetical protein
MSESPSNGRRTSPRVSPYQVVFAGAPFETEHFPAIQVEAEERGADAANPSQFLLLGSVGRILRELLPADSPGAAVEQYGKLLFQGYHFWRFGRRTFSLELPVIRHLVESSPRLGDWEMTSPHPAGYVQLPANLFWATITEPGPPEPVDGLFWTMIGQEDPAAPPFARLDVLLPLGVRPGRPGFSVVGVGTDLGPRPPGHEGEVNVRPDGRDFANVLPGGEIEGLYALVTEAEALKLVSLVFWYMARYPEAVRPVPAPDVTTKPGQLAEPDRPEARETETEAGAGAEIEGDRFIVRLVDDLTGG